MENTDLKAKYDETCAELEKLKAALATAEALAKEANAKVEASKLVADAANASVQEVTAKAEVESKARLEAEAKLAQIEKDAKAKERYTEIEKLEALAGFGADSKAQLEVLASMNPDTYGFVLAVAKTSFAKLTDQRKSSAPALTDQTLSAAPKLTDQSPAKASEIVAALEEAKPDATASLVQAGTSEDGGKEALSKFFSDKSRYNKKEKSSKSK